MIGVGDLFRSATTNACKGCIILHALSQQVHVSIYGQQMKPEQFVFVNYGLMFPPKEFLILPRGNIMDQSGKIEVFKTGSLGQYFIVILVINK